MPRPGTARNRGYDAAHDRAVAQLFRELVDGARCPRCGRPMFRDAAQNFDGAKLEGDHFGQPLALGAGLPDTLAHRRCNRSAGARLGNQMRGARRHGQPMQVPEPADAWGEGTPSRSW